MTVSETVQWTVSGHGGRSPGVRELCATEEQRLDLGDGAETSMRCACGSSWVTVALIEALRERPLCGGEGRLANDPGDRLRPERAEPKGRGFRASGSPF
ncbi:hypothetical protein SAMN05444714_1804 [Yoonia litorea]|uniref:Uncharacterized protein n=1 Tax=Yoonia litorea TaxID=1123755 RepID=A0A1I6MHC1_9RHOB|nr:hypothetical protein SAMN05444714_1804 [Yoonia litorea]